MCRIRFFHTLFYGSTILAATVERDLASKGYFKTTGGDPELLVTYELVITDKEDVITHNYDYWRGAPSETYVDVSVYREGTLVVDIVDPAQNRVIFRGWATGVVQGELSPEQSEALINRAISKILGKFPPN